MSSLYIHIPFCDQICFYCDFPKRLASENQKDAYLDALLWELKQYQLTTCTTIYMGGGTPSSFGMKRLTKLFKALPKVSVEFTFEMNPKDVSKELLDLLFEHGITRISLGVQSTNDQLLKAINRDHTWKMIEESIHLIDRYPFRLNVDLMYNLPKQSVEDIKLDIKRMRNVDHISYYSLILEEKTVFFHRVNEGSLILDELDITDEDIAKELMFYGFQRYEISNYTKSSPSYHNLIYWNNKEYIGVGMGASGYVGGIRYKNVHFLDEYLTLIKNQLLPIEEETKLEKADQMYEFFMLGFRKVEGISLSDFEERYNENAFMAFPALHALVEDGFLSVNNDTMKPTSKGLLYNNELLLRLL